MDTILEYVIWTLFFLFFSQKDDPLWLKILRTTALIVIIGVLLVVAFLPIIEWLLK